MHWNGNQNYEEQPYRPKNNYHNYHYREKQAIKELKAQANYFGMRLSLLNQKAEEAQRNFAQARNKFKSKGRDNNAAEFERILELLLLEQEKLSSLEGDFEDKIDNLSQLLKNKKEYLAKLK